MNISEILKRKRSDAGLSLAALAEKTGYDLNSIRRFEWGTEVPTETYLNYFSKALSLSTEELSEIFEAISPEPRLIRTGGEQTKAQDCPYKGLSPFREKDQQIYFGREMLVDSAQRKLKSEFVLAIVGASGSGKSSFVSAGLLPALKKLSPVKIAQFRPGTKPLENLALSLVPLLEPDRSALEHTTAAVKFAAQFNNDSLYLAIESLLNLDDDSRILLFCDQFEEVYSQCGDETVRRTFLDCLVDAMRSVKRLDRFMLVLTVRGDFFGTLLQHRRFAELLQERILTVPPMSDSDLRRAIEEPAAIYGFAFQEGVVDEIVKDAAEQPGILPLVQFALTQLWRNREGQIMTLAGYRRIGRLEGAIAKEAERVFLQLTQSGQRVARTVLTRLVNVARPSEGGRDTRRRCPLSEVAILPEALPLIYSLTSSRLLVMDYEESLGERVVELVHEAVIRSWSRLQTWLVEDREFLLWQQRITALMNEWKHSGEDSHLLLRGKQLDEVTSWRNRRPDEPLRSEVEQFISESFKLLTMERNKAAFSKLNRLLNCPIEETSEALRIIQEDNTLSTDFLKKRLEENKSHPQAWRIRLALLSTDNNQIRYIIQYLLEAEPAAIPLIGLALKPYQQTVTNELIALLQSPTNTPSEHLRAAAALIHIGTPEEKFVMHANDLIKILVDQNPVFLKDWSNAMYPLRKLLFGPLRTILKHPDARETQRAASASILAQWIDDPALLAEVTCEVPGHTYEQFVQTLMSADENNVKKILNSLESIAIAVPSNCKEQSEKIHSGRKRAASAITLLRLGEVESVKRFFQFEEDIEHLTQFISEAKYRGVSYSTLANMLLSTNNPSELYTLLLVLGKYPFEADPLLLRARTRASELFSTHPHAGVHSAARWLLMIWSELELIKEIESTPEPLDPTLNRSWFRLIFREQPLTFSIIPAGDFLIGSPMDELERSVYEGPQFRVTIPRPFALCNREITRSEFERFVDESKAPSLPDISEWSPEGAEPVVGITWYEALEYCNWMNTQLGIPHDRTPLEPVTNLIRTTGHGIRLPTEAEWEYACRAGTITPYFFGSDAEHLPQFAWFQNNSGLKTNKAGLLFPNPFGLFNISGNCWEWCHDSYAPYTFESLTYLSNIPGGERRALRGGCWNLSARYCRSACRNAHLPTNRNWYIGMRLLFQLTESYISEHELKA